MKKPVITVVGSYAAGLTMMTRRFPTSGETLMGWNYRQMHGGKGSNQAVECARLGADVNFIACLGKDVMGDSAVDLYRQEGIDCSNVKFSENLPTGVGFIIVNEHGHNIITLDMGANKDLTPGYVQEKEEVIASSDVCLIQLEISPETVAAAASIAAGNGVRVILNPAPYQKLPDTIWNTIDILTPNEKEAKLLLGYGPDEEIGIPELAYGILSKGVNNVIITLGGRGAYYAAGNEGGNCGFIPAKKVNVVDTTGAGDTFSSALGVATSEGKNLHDAVLFASAAAALSVTRYGVIESMPYRGEVEEMLKR